MRVSILQDKFKKGIDQVMGVVEGKHTLPVLQNILLKTENARLMIVGTNLESSIEIVVGAKIDIEGQITLPGKTLQALIAKFPAERVDISVDYATLTATIKCGTSKSQLKGIDAAEFPLIQPMNSIDFELSAAALKGIIQHALPAAAKERNRPILCGIHLVSDGNILEVQAADGYRLYCATLELPSGTPIFNVVLPIDSMKLLVKLITTDVDSVGINVGGARDVWMFQCKHTTLSTQLLEGKYPDIVAIIPRTYNTKMVLYTADLLNAVDRAQVFGHDNAYSMKMEIMPPTGPGEPGVVTLTGYSAERGMLEGSLDATVEGDALAVSFNSKYMLDIPFEDERLVLESNGPQSAIVLRPENSDHEVYVMMPISTAR